MLTNLARFSNKGTTVGADPSAESGHTGRKFSQILEIREPGADPPRREWTHWEKTEPDSVIRKPGAGCWQTL